ncbi:hypothetical protein B0O99DRAFT_678881 [Bisporella sp. PMI_857]|nr:hypothetical protein B0O99DRAFT_678881 [Bisporella sp. PMI_857]
MARIPWLTSSSGLKRFKTSSSRGLRRFRSKRKAVTSEDVSVSSSSTIDDNDIPRNIHGLAINESSMKPTVEEIPLIAEEPQLSQFTCFPELPTELRLKIWGFAACHPRSINIWSSDFGKKIGIPLRANEDDETDFVIWKLCSKTAPPTILSVCSESRTEALKYYRLEFGTEFKFADFTFTTHPRIYVNFEVDRICFLESFDNETSRSSKNFFNRCLTNGTKYLALNIKSFQNESRTCSYIKPFLMRCLDDKLDSSLEDIILLSPEYDRSTLGELEFKPWDAVQETQEHNTTHLQGIKKWLIDTGEVTEGSPMVGKRGLTIDVKFLFIDGKQC